MLEARNSLHGKALLLLVAPVPLEDSKLRILDGGLLPHRPSVVAPLAPGSAPPLGSPLAVSPPWKRESIPPHPHLGPPCESGKEPFPDGRNQDAKRNEVAQEARYHEEHPRNPPGREPARTAAENAPGDEGACEVKKEKWRADPLPDLREAEHLQNGQQDEKNGDDGGRAQDTRERWGAAALPPPAGIRARSWGCRGSRRGRCPPEGNQALPFLLPNSGDKWPPANTVLRSNSRIDAPGGVV